MGNPVDGLGWRLRYSIQLQHPFRHQHAGYYVAFVEEDRIFTPDCDWLGVLRREEIYNTNGDFVGFLWKDDRVVRDRSAHFPRRILRPITPRRPIRPLPPKRQLFLPGLSDPLEDTFLGLRRPLKALTTLGRLEELFRFEGCSILAADGTFLGRFSRDWSDEDSVARESGVYGSPNAEGSIFNERGPYGSVSSPLSPFHPTSDTPPRMEREGELVTHLTVNPEVSERVDPNELLAWLTLR